MNFFEHQDRARRRTGRLVVLFVIAVFLILVAVNAAAFGILRILAPYSSYIEDAGPVVRGEREYPGTLTPVEPVWEQPLIYGGVSLATLLIIGGGSAYKTAALSRGGHAVASLLGGRPLDPAAAQGQDRVLQNVVEEMSIASGVPVPAVYVLENERSINAFAAGFTTEDAVIGVTRGLLEKLNRDEIQGVVAHEFSHILNGDMRLNIRLIGILHGILVIGLLGYALLRSLRYVRTSGRRNDKGGNILIVIALAGAAMLVIGYVGVFFGRLIQSAVSRQREFLADASAVQFTRNPRGIGGALMKIAAYSAGSQLQNHHAVETAHLFFSSGIHIGLTNLLATHPPLQERIRRIDPSWDGRLPRLSELQASEPPPPPRGVSAAAPGAVATPGAAVESAAGFASFLPRTGGGAQRTALNPMSLIDRAGAPSPASVAFAGGLLRSIPSQVLEAAHDPFSARAVVCSLALSTDPAVRQKQMATINQTDPACHRDVRRLHEAIDALGPAARLPLIDLALPALRQMSPQQIQQFRRLVREMVEADAKVSLFEYALLKVLSQSLKTPDERARRGAAKYYAVNAIKDQAAVLLSALAQASETDTRAAFDAGAKRLDPDKPPTMTAAPGLAAVNRALDALEHASPAVKQRLIEACAHTVAADGSISVDEAELLRAIASTMDVPLPPLVGGALPSVPSGAAMSAGRG